MRTISLFHKKIPPVVETKITVPSIYNTGPSLYPPLKLSSAVSARPKREIRRVPLFPDNHHWTNILGDSAGDDAFVIGKYYLGIPSENNVDIGVADGVGAWNTKEYGRPGLWSRLLMHYYALECEERIKLWKVDRAIVPSDEDQVDIVKMLHRAYLRTACEMERTGGWVGSTTACVALLQRSTLHIANVFPLNRC